jgi:hypothetical protein
MYSEVNNSAAIRLNLYSENDNTTGIDYYTIRFVVDWTGWKVHICSIEEQKITFWNSCSILQDNNLLVIEHLLDIQR